MCIAAQSADPQLMPRTFPDGPCAAVSLALSTFEAADFTAAIVEDARRRAVLLAAPWPMPPRAAVDHQQSVRVLLLRSRPDAALHWPDWPASAAGLERHLGAPLDLVDVITIAAGRWRSVLCPDAGCCPPQGRLCA